MTADPAARARAAFTRAYGAEPVALHQAPGRVNLIGEHTDYNDGFVLPCAIDRRTIVASSPSPDALIHVAAADLEESDAFASVPPIAARGGWADYVRGVASELLAAGHQVAPRRLAIAGDVPLGAGLSSSASLEIAVAMALANGPLDPVEAARIGQRAENNFVGCQCGIMDQLVAAAAVADHALLIDCRSLDRRAVRLPRDCALVVIDSGVRHAHASGDYNLRRAECERAARHYGVAALRDLDEQALAAGAAGLDDVAFRRARHVVSENRRVLAAADALARGDLPAMGTLMAESHRSMRDDFEISVPAIDAIVARCDEAIAGDGGARMTGGGFGGSVVALVPGARLAGLINHLETSAAPGETVAVYRAAAGAGPIDQA